MSTLRTTRKSAAIKRKVAEEIELEARSSMPLSKTDSNGNVVFFGRENQSRLRKLSTKLNRIAKRRLKSRAASKAAKQARKQQRGK